MRKLPYLNGTKAFEASARTGSFAKDPPNATASVFSKDGASVSDVVVVLKAARLEGEKLTFDVHVLEGSLEDDEGKCTAGNFVWRPAGSRHTAKAPNGAMFIAFFGKASRRL